MVREALQGLGSSFILTPISNKPLLNVIVLPEGCIDTPLSIICNWAGGNPQSSISGHPDFNIEGHSSSTSLLIFYNVVNQTRSGDDDEYSY